MKVQKNKKIKIILKQTIRRLGTAGSVKQVAKGYAINFLYPRNLAIKFSQETYDNMHNNQAQLVDTTLASEAQVLVEKINGIYLYFARPNTVKANSIEGILYGSVNAQDIANEICLTIDTNKVTKENIDLLFKIKHTGIYDIEVVLYNNVIAHCKIAVYTTIAEAKNAVSESLKNAQKGDNNVE